MPKSVTWVEEYAHKDAKGQITRKCSAISKNEADWRSESATMEAELVISICKSGKVTSTQSPPVAASPGPLLPVKNVYDAILRAKFEAVDIIGGTGFSRYRENGPDGSVQVIWIDRTAGFPLRSTTTYPDGSVLDRAFRIVKVDPSTQRRLFEPNALHPFFGHYLDEWHGRVTK